ncbi:MAG: efflux RND transporter periplasmic adaptor subunit [Bryobacterales bacterium]|nr:efflux RND transporter periplasmic adaptor subunit [Bryobacterales bacterium]
MIRGFRALGATLLLLSVVGCNERTEAHSNPQPKPPPARPGEVTLPPGSPKLQEIRVAEVKLADVPTDEVVAPGKIEVNPNRVSRVVLPVAGRITKVLARLGDAVTEGQPLLEVESPDADAAMSAQLQASAAVTQAKANLLKSQADLDRIRDLYAHQAVAQKEVLNAENARTQSVTALEQAEAANQQALRRLDILGLKPGNFGQRVIVRAPIAGKVLEVNVAPGEFRNDTSQSLMTIADLRTVWVASDVPETSIRFIQVGERLEIELAAYPNEKFSARVKQIADVMDPQTRTVKVRAEMDNSSGRLRPEMFGSIRHVESVVPRPVVPSAAVIQGDGENVVYVQLSPGVFRMTPIRVGNPVDGNLPVLEGLRPGQTVVVDGVMLLKGL